MHVSQAFDIINSYKPNQVETLADLLPIELINSTYELTDTVTLRKRKLTLESKAWLLVLWRTEDSKDNAEALAKPTHKEGKETQYPQVMYGKSDGIEVSFNHRQCVLLPYRE